MKSSIGQGPHYTIFLKRETSPGNKNPGPGNYAPEDGLTHERAPQWKFSDNAQGNHNGPQTNPNGLGPGEYNLKTHIGEGPLYTIGEKRLVNIDNKFPGPATYHPDDG
jgi:hypothetical protein